LNTGPNLEGANQALALEFLVGGAKLSNNSGIIKGKGTEL